MSIIPEIDLLRLYKKSKPKYLLICSYTLDLSFLEQQLLLYFRKKYLRIISSGSLIGFEIAGIKWDLIPETAFYDWLYINALIQNEELSYELLKYKSFSDIEYNPKRQISCQARSAAYFVSLSKLNLIIDYTKSKKDFLQLYKDRPHKTDEPTFAF